jgi:hypothetical protein
MVLIRFIIGLSLAALSFISCDNEGSLQRYLVDKQDDDKFVKVDLATSLFESENSSFTTEQREILNTIKKVNVVAFPIKEGNIEDYEAERLQLKAIIDQEKYKTLTTFSSNNTKATLKYLGEEEAIDEVVIFASNSDKGFAVFRLLGEKMRPEQMLKLMGSIQSGDLDVSKLTGLGAIFNTDSDSI